MKRTVSIPVYLPAERFLPLMSECAEIFNVHVDWALTNRTYNKNKAHKELYHLLRLQHPSVPSALVQTIRDNALEAIKATKFKRIPRKKPTSALRYDTQGHLSISTEVGGLLPQEVFCTSYFIFYTSYFSRLREGNRESSRRA
jgi:hypothetical protein